MICKNCHREYDDNKVFCTQCGTKLEPNNPPVVQPPMNGLPVTPPMMQQPMNGLPATPQMMQQPMNGLPTNEPVVKKKKTALKTTAIIALILVAVIVARWVAFPFVQAMVRSTFNPNAPIAIEDIVDDGRGKKVTEELPVSGSEPVEIEANGLTVSIPENAMEPDQTVTVEQLSDDGYAALMEELIDPNFVALDAFDFNAGLGDDGRFYENTTLTFDLKEMDIPKRLWPYMVVYRQGEDGSLEEIKSEVDGKQLVCETNKNCIVIPGLIILTGLSAVWAGLKLYPDIKDKYFIGNPDYENIPWYKTTTIPGYTVYWPDAMPVGNPDAVKTASDEMNAIVGDILEQMGEGVASVEEQEVNARVAKSITNIMMLKGKNESQQAVGLRDGVRQLCGEILENKEYRNLYEEVTTLKWQKENVWPVQVRVCMDAISNMDKYLFKVRNFKKPTSNTEIVILPKWPHGSGYGLAFNPQVGASYMHVNAAAGLPKTLEEYNNTEKYQKAIDELLLTITHEMIHVSQSECYCSVDLLRYKALFEAVAVSLEREAYKYYSDDKQKIIMTKEAKSVLTPSTFFENFTNTLGNTSSPYSFEDESEVAEWHGYALADYLDFMRDKNYFGNRKDVFLERLMEAFSKQWSYDFNKAVESACLTNDKYYNEEFTEFMIKKQETIYTRFYAAKGGKLEPWNTQFMKQTYALSDKKPVVTIPAVEGAYRSTIQELKISVPPTMKKEDVNLVIHKDFEMDQNVENDELYLCVRLDGEKSFTVAQKTDTVYKKVGTGSTVINEIHSYSDKADIDGNDAYQAILMTKPAPPIANMDENNLVIDLPESALAQAGFIKNYVVSIVVDDKKKPVVIETTERHIVIDTEEDPQLKEANDTVFDDDAKAKILAGLKPEEKLGAEMFFNGELGDISDILAWSKFFQKRTTGEEQVEHEYKITYAEQLKSDDVILGPVSDETVVQLMADDSAVFEGDFLGRWEGKLFFVPDETFAFEITEPESDYADRGYDYKVRLGGDVFYGELTENGNALQLYYVENEPMTGEALAEFEEYFGKDSFITKWIASGRSKGYKLIKFGKERLSSYIPPVIYHRVD
jgi:hypothetical protein